MISFVIDSYIRQARRNRSIMGMFLFVLSFTNITQGMEQQQSNIPEKLFFVVYPSEAPKIFMVEEFTSASVGQNNTKQQIFDRMQQGDRHVLINLDGFAVYLILSEKIKPFIQTDQLKEFIAYELAKKRISNNFSGDAHENEKQAQLDIVTAVQEMCDAKFQYQLKSK